VSSMRSVRSRSKKGAAPKRARSSEIRDSLRCTREILWREIPANRSRCQLWRIQHHVHLAPGVRLLEVGDLVTDGELRAQIALDRGVLRLQIVLLGVRRHDEAAGLTGQVVQPIELASFRRI